VLRAAAQHFPQVSQTLVLVLVGQMLLPLARRMLPRAQRVLPLLRVGTLERQVVPGFSQHQRQPRRRPKLQQ
jgi:hypothetical protein